MTTDDKSTPNSAPISGLPLDALIGIDAKLSILEEQLSQHADNEQHYPEVAKVFDGLRNYVKAVRESINREESTTQQVQEASAPDKKPETVVPPIVTELSDWFNAMPNQFPDFIGVSEEASLVMNPHIGEKKQDTLDFVHDGLVFLKEFILPDDPKEGVLLNNNAAWALFRYLETLQFAIDFEATHRRDGGIPTGDYYKH